MSAIRLEGAELAGKLCEQVTAESARLTANGYPPTLAVVTATGDESSAWYVRSLCRSAERTGIRAEVVDLRTSADHATIEQALCRLSTDDAVHGIILQTPLPPGISLADVADAIAPAKDIDGANPVSLGRLAAGLPAFAPATAEAVVALLDHHGIPLSGRDVVVIGRSMVVGKPVALLLVNRDATVTICHSHTRDLAEHSRRADVLVVATGRPGTVTGVGVAAGACVIDVGTNPDGAGGLVGDVEPGSVGEVAGALTPVPGGVGPVTAMLLMQHVVSAAAHAR
jgi:methylenetetrahydrofolate dehydrogenase (NADP+)/methenyltetrahydrofolate cyclohydrolase